MACLKNPFILFISMLSEDQVTLLFYLLLTIQRYKCITLVEIRSTPAPIKQEMSYMNGCVLIY